MKQLIKNYWPYLLAILAWFYFATAVALETIHGTQHSGDWLVIGISGLLLGLLLVWISWEVRQGIYALFARMIAGKQPQEEMFQGMFKISKKRPSPSHTNREKE